MIKKINLKLVNVFFIQVPFHRSLSINIKHFVCNSFQSIRIIKLLINIVTMKENFKDSFNIFWLSCLPPGDVCNFRKLQWICNMVINKFIKYEFLHEHVFPHSLGMSGRILHSSRTMWTNLRELQTVKWS